MTSLNKSIFRPGLADGFLGGGIEDLDGVHVEGHVRLLAHAQAGAGSTRETKVFFPLTR